MEFELLTLDINKNSQSYISLLRIQSWHLFYIEWNYDNEIEMMQIAGMWI